MLRWILCLVALVRGHYVALVEWGSTLPNVTSASVMVLPHLQLHMVLFPNHQLHAVQSYAASHHGTVHWIEEDQVVEALDLVETSSDNGSQNVKGVSWALDRIDQRQDRLDGVYKFPLEAGAGITAYVIDTGIDVDLREFGGRAKWGANYADRKNSDENGHGTAVAAVLGGSTYGVAKNVSLVAVKVLDAKGRGSVSSILRGLEYVLKEHRSSSSKTNIINMSLGSTSSQSINLAVNRVVRQGIPVIVAGGNSGDDACEYSPSSARFAISVGATTPSDNYANFSNIGPCLDVFAPGANVTTLGTVKKEETKDKENPRPANYSGTSLASPIVAGVVALAWSANTSLTPNQVMNKVLDSSTQGVVSGSLGKWDETPNRLVYSLL